MSHVRLADKAEDIESTRVGTGMADLVIGCDLIVTAGKEALSRMGEGRTHGASIPAAAQLRLLSRIRTGNSQRVPLKMKSAKLVAKASSTWSMQRTSPLH